MKQVRALQRALKRCDACHTCTQLTSVLEQEVHPVLNALLTTELVRAPREHTLPDECSPAVVAVREWLTGSESETGYGTDDVWFFLYRHAAALLERHSRKRARAERERADTVASARTTLLTNCFVLFCNRSLPALSDLTLRWTFLRQERDRVEASDGYVNANAAERRRMLLSHVALAVFSERAHRHDFTAFWMQCMTSMDHTALHLHLIHRLGNTILPYLTNPLVVADYLTGCFRSGGLMAVLALQSLFVLMLDHGLEYPQYYEQLYSLITAHAFASRHRYDLFRLLDLSMTSVRVPAYIAASVVKRVARVALLAPLPTLYFVLPFIRKVLQRHPSCLGLIHRHSKEAMAPVVEEKEEDGTMTTSDRRAAALRERALLFDGHDPYNPDAPLADSHALNSTLWELTALERHFLPAVPVMVAAYGSTAEDTAPLRYMKTYARLFTAEVTRVVDREHMPTVAYQEPTTACTELVHL